MSETRSSPSFFLFHRYHYHYALASESKSPNYNRGQKSWDTSLSGGNFELRSPCLPLTLVADGNVIDDFTTLCSSVKSTLQWGWVFSSGRKWFTYMQGRHLSARNSFVATNFGRDCRSSAINHGHSFLSQSLTLYHILTPSFLELLCFGTTYIALSLPPP